MFLRCFGREKAHFQRVFGLLRVIWGVLLPVAWVVDIFVFDVEISGEFFDEHFDPSYLRIGGSGVFGVSDDADSDCLCSSVPGFSWNYGPLSLPFFCILNLSIFSTEAITNHKMAVKIFGTCQTAYRSELFDVTGLCVAVVGFDGVPSAFCLYGF